jgi:Na+/proline symporter
LAGLANRKNAFSLLAGGGSGKLFRYIQTIQFLLGSPIMAIFIVGLVWPRANQPGALGGFLVGLLLAAARFATEYIYASPACGEEDTRPAFASINYMYFGKHYNPRYICG